MLDTLRTIGAHPRLEPTVSRALRARAVTPSARFFVKETLRRGSGIYGVRGSRARLSLEHGTTDAGTYDQAFIRDSFRIPPEVETHFAQIQTPLRALDLGANIGMWSSWLLARDPTALVTAVEPLPRNVRLLRQNLDLADAQERYTIVEAAAGASEGTATFGGGDFTNGRLNGDAAGISVRVIDALPLIAESDLTKIDIEGGEWPILVDPRFTAIPTPIVMLEVHPMGAPTGDPVAHANEILLRAGYRTTPPTQMDHPGTGIIWGYDPARIRAD